METATSTTKAPPRSDQPVIRLEGLTKGFGESLAVNNLSLEIPSGGVTGFVGPNGAGKSTTFRMLLGLIKPTSGAAWMLGHPIDDPRRYIDQVGALVESPALYPKLTGYNNLLSLARLSGLPNRQIDKVLEIVDLTERSGDRYDNYSLGMKQRLGIAAALLSDPKLLMLDEPTNGLDPAGTVEIRALFRRLAENGTSVVVSSHLLSEIQAASDRIVMIQKGQLVFSGPLDDLLATRQSSVTAVPADPSDLDALAGLVASAGKSFEVSEGRLDVAAEAEWSAVLSRLAMDANIVLSELRPVEPDLESAFLQMTAESGIDTQP